MNPKPRYFTLSATIRVLVAVLTIGGSGTMLGGTLALADHYAFAAEAPTPTLVTRTAVPKNAALVCDNVAS